MGLGARLSAAKEILWGRWWFRIALAAWFVVSGYDTFSGAVSQVLPRYQLTPLGTLLMGGSHLLPWWGWLLVLYGLVSLSLFEYVVRHVEEMRATRITTEGGTDSGGLSVKEWVTPLHAIRFYLHEYYWRAIADTQAKYDERLERSNAAHREWALRPDDLELRDTFQDLSTSTSVADRMREVAHAVANRALVNALTRGSLIARGLAGPDVTEVDIPTPQWRVMTLNHTAEDASGHRLRYGGIRIGFPNRPTEDARLPLPLDAEMEAQQ